MARPAMTMATGARSFRRARVGAGDGLRSIGFMVCLSSCGWDVVSQRSLRTARQRSVLPIVKRDVTYRQSACDDLRIVRTAASLALLGDVRHVAQREGDGQIASVACDAS